MNIAGHKFNSSPNADPDARRYLTAAGIVPGQVYAGDGVNDYPLPSERIIKSVTTTLHTSLKTAGIYTKMRHMYAFLGNTTGNNLTNLLHPGVRDLVVVSGSTTPSFSRKGLLGTSTTVLNTGIRLSEFEEYNMSMGVYMNGSSGGFTFGTTNTNGGTYTWGIAAGTVWFKSTSSLVASSSTPGGLFVMNQTAINRKTLYRRGVQEILDTTTTSSSTHNSDYREVWLNNINFSDTAAGAGNISGVGFFFASTGLTDAENVTLNTIIDRFMFEIRGRDNGDVPYDNWQFKGDSIMYGYNGTGYHPWVNQIAAYNNVRSINYGVPNTMITACDMSNLVPKDANHTKVFIAYSTNDFYYDFHSNGSIMNISLYISTYTTKISEVVAKGYSLSDIILIAAYNTNPGQYGIGADALHEQYAQAAFTIATNTGIPIINVWNWKPVMIANGAVPVPGDVHPTNFGHDICSGDGNARMDNINSL